MAKCQEADPVSRRISKIAAPQTGRQRIAGRSGLVERAARLTFEGRMTEEAIAAELGVARRTLNRWKATPEFHTLIEQHRAAARQVELQHTIADRRKRVGLLESRRQKLQDGFDRIIAERGIDMAAIPGGASGLLARQFKQIGAGEKTEKVEEYKIDPGILAISQELRELERQAAIELGQWQADQSGEGEDGFTLTDIAVLMRVAQRRVRSGGAYGDSSAGVETTTATVAGRTVRRSRRGPGQG